MQQLFGDPASPPFSVSVVPDRTEVSVQPVGELDLATVGELEAEIRDLSTSGFTCIVVDLRGLAYIDSTGLRAFLTLREEADRDGHRLEFVPGPSAVQRVFELTRTRSLFSWREA